jgi:tetratricopeptide (TPR) repeat protein
MISRKVFILLSLSVVISAAAVRGVFVTPDEPLTSMSRCQISDTDTRNARPLRAWSHNPIGHIRQTRGLFEAFESQNRDNAQAAIGLGYCAYRENDPAAAEAQFLSALRQVPHNADALGGLGLTYSRAGRRGEAISRLEAAPTLTPDNQELRDVLERARTSQ